jgi:hypothetical protein
LNFVNFPDKKEGKMKRNDGILEYWIVGEKIYKKLPNPNYIDPLPFFICLAPLFHYSIIPFFSYTLPPILY